MTSQCFLNCPIRHTQQRKKTPLRCSVFIRKYPYWEQSFSIEFSKAFSVYKRYYEQIDGKNTDISKEIPFDLPQGWAWVRISTVLSLQAGKFISASEISDEKNEKYCYPCYGGNGLRGFVERFNTVGRHPLIGRQGALCGNINFTEGNFYATEHAVVVDLFSHCSPEWAAFFYEH